MESRVPEALRGRLGEQASLELVDVLEEACGEWSDRVLTIAEDRFERRLALVEERYERRLVEGLAALRGETGQLEIKLRKEMHEGFSSILRWSFLFWIGQVAATAGMLALMLRSLAGH